MHCAFQVSLVSVYKACFPAGKSFANGEISKDLIGWQQTLHDDISA
jgi:hypothetical protein